MSSGTASWRATRLCNTWILFHDCSPEGRTTAEHVSIDEGDIAVQDWSWDAPALDYIDLYFRALK